MFLQGLENADAQNPNTLKTPSCELRGHEGELLAKLFFYPSASIKAFFLPRVSSTLRSKKLQFETYVKMYATPR